ncbi:MAG: hypothetical protein WAR39_03550 [Prevotella sp.]
MNNLLKDWSTGRIIRLLTGIGFGVYAIISKDNLFYILAGLLLLQGILNFSFCGAGCSSGGTQHRGVYEFKKYKPEK